MSNLKRNAISNVILTGSSVLLPLLTFPYVTKTLSTTSFGQFLFIDSFTQYFVLTASLGIPLYGLREIAKNRNNEKACSKIVLELCFIQFCLGVFFSILFIASSYFIPSIGISRGLVIIGGVYIISSGFLIDWFYQGIEKFSYITIRSLAVKVCSVIAIFLLVKDEYDSLIYYGILTSVLVLNMILNIHYFIKNYFIAPTYSLELKKHIKPLLILFSINASVSVYVILDSIILGFLTDANNVSYYNIPLKIVKIYWTIIAAVGTVFIPKIAVLYSEDKSELISNLVSKSINVVIFLSLPFFFLCVIFPSEILQLISGSKYLHATIGLQVLSVLPLVIGICNIFGTQYLLPIGKEKIILKATVLGLIVSITLNLVLIPKINFLGAAISAAITETFVCVFVVVKARRFLTFVVDYSFLIQIVLCLICSFLVWRFITIKIDKELIRISLTFGSYIFFLIVTQIFFKNAFISTLLSLKIKR